MAKELVGSFFFQDEPNEYKSKLLLYTKFDISTYCDIE